MCPVVCLHVCVCVFFPRPAVRSMITRRERRPGKRGSGPRGAGSRERPSIRTVGEAAASTTALVVPRQRITVAREPAAAFIWLSCVCSACPFGIGKGKWVSVFACVTIVILELHKRRNVKLAEHRYYMTNIESLFARCFMLFIRF